MKTMRPLYLEDLMFKRNKPRLHVPLLSIVLATLIITGSFFAVAYAVTKLQSEEGDLTTSIVEPTPTPNFIEKKEFGFSTEGKPIEGYVIGHGEDVLFLFGAIHGNEMGTSELLGNLIEEISHNHELVAPSKKLVIIPISNPDGYYDRIDKLNANEVNLNLNFPTDDWAQYGPEGMFAGEEPFTEIESNVLRQVVENYKPDMMLAYHSQGSLVSPEEGDDSIRLGKWYAQKTGYQYFDEWDYAGTATRWFYEIYNKPAITIELSDHQKSDWNINRKAILELISSPTVLP
jgi:predicted deacylase